jgi:cyclase
MCRDATSRRDFFRDMILGPYAGAPLLALASLRAAWAQASSAGAPTDLFDIQPVAEDVYFAFARPQAIANCNAAIFVNRANVLVVDAHSKPSAASALIAQIRKQITPKPVHYLVDTHFHWDHAQGNAGYREAFGRDLEILSSTTTRRLEAALLAPRLQASLDPHGHPFSSQPHIPILLEEARKQLGAARFTQQRAALAERIRQLESFAREMRDFRPELPTVTFDKSYVIRDKAHDLHIEFHGRAHTAGDVIVYCPQKRVVATGDMVIGTLPFLGDSYPKEWPKTIDSVAKLDFNRVCGGHGTVAHGKQRMMDQRNYIEELAERVEKGKNDGLSLAEIQKSIPVASIKSFAADNYGAFLSSGRDPASMQQAVNTNIEHIFLRLVQN